MTAGPPFELAIERYIDAPPETVFKVWTDLKDAKALRDELS